MHLTISTKKQAIPKDGLLLKTIKVSGFVTVKIIYDDVYLQYQQDLEAQELLELEQHH